MLQLFLLLLFLGNPHKLLKGVLLQHPQIDSERVVQYLSAYKIAPVKVKYSFATKALKY